MEETYPRSNVKVVDVTFDQHADEALSLGADQSTDTAEGAARRRYLLDI